VVYKVRLHPPSGCQGMAGRKGLLLKYVNKLYILIKWSKRHKKSADFFKDHRPKTESSTRIPVKRTLA
jgi:hypothetical protein